MQRSFFNSLALYIVVAGSLFILLWFSVGACVAFATTFSSTEELPTLQVVIPLTNTMSPFYVSVIPGGYAYVLEEFGPIIVVDGTKLITVMALPAGNKSAYYFDRMAIHPQTKLGYLPNPLSDSLYIIKETEIITVLHNLGKRPKIIDINPNTGLVYVGSSLTTNDTKDGSSVSVINESELITTLVTGLGPNVITADPNSSKVYIGQTLLKESPYPYERQNLLTVMDTTKVVTQTSLNYAQDMPGYSSGDINNIAIDPNSGEIYMIEGLGRIVYWHNGQIKRIRLGSMGYTGLHDIAIDPNRGLAYVSSWGEPSHVVVLKQGELVTALPVGKDPRAVVFDETHDYVYVANRLGGSLSVIRGSEVITTIDARGNPWDIGVDEERGYIYLANPDSHNITVFGFEQEIKQRSFWSFLPFVGN